MSMKLKSIPKFRSEAEERRFWETHDSSDYVDWSKAERVRLPNLKPSTTSISWPKGVSRQRSCSTMAALPVPSALQAAPLSPSSPWAAASSASQRGTTRIATVEYGADVERARLFLGKRPRLDD